MKDGRSIDHATLEEFRFAAVRLRRGGVPVLTIARSFGVTTEAVYIWLKKAKTNGINSLKGSKSLGREPALGKEQFAALIQSIHKLPAPLFCDRSPTLPEKGSHTPCAPLVKNQTIDGEDCALPRQNRGQMWSDENQSMHSCP